ncbi:FMN-binding glutamate synthase family protein [Catenovulum adriaticum]|uniref:FMN-binding glutamate synthase family protein n=1 Tax=Catenovulum adriaticum TaxID=2984846 RepID=A0ABY7ARC2_9ALTE|nr:FMN-binding glutamate synthase family protein [Catenovulum sp. TS8]WAJ71676.1 FMN-binding glutamate synthase family protein [Catenovulum sp. TS8]
MASSRTSTQSLKGFLDSLKRSVLLVSVAILSVIFIVCAFLNPWWLIGLVFTLPLFIVGVFDHYQTRWTLTRNFPLASRIRWIFYDLRPYLRSYIVEGNLEGKPFSLKARDLVHARARGKTDTRPFGTELNTNSPEYEWLNHSIIPIENPDENPRVSVGNEQSSTPYSASILNISAMSFGALSAHAVEALNKGAKIGGFYQDTGEGGISPYHQKHGGDLVCELGSGYFGCRNNDGTFNPSRFAEGASQAQIKMTEIKLSQGAKPGHGGLLPGAKVTEEIARVRQVTAYEDCQSPRAHSAFSTPIGLLEFAAKMRELSGGKPVGIKLCVGHIHEVFAIMKAMHKTGIYLDYIVVDGGEGGTGAAPLELSDYVGMPLTEGLITVRNALVGTGLRDKVRLAASGKVYSATGLARNFAIGADWCNAARAFMFSIGCIQAQRCHLGTCPTGITTQDPGRQRGLVVDVQAERAARFHQKTLVGLSDIIASTGVTHPRDLQPHHIIHRLGDTDSKMIDRIYSFLPKNILLDAPEETYYAEWWKAASADSFAPQIDLAPMRDKNTQAEKQGSML